MLRFTRAPPAREVKSQCQPGAAQAKGLEKYSKMSIIGLLCLLFALIAALFLVLYGLQRRDLRSVAQLSRELQRVAIGGRLPGRIDLDSD